MSLDIGDALSEGFDRTFKRNGLLLAAVFVVFGFVNTVVQQSYLEVQYEAFDVAAYLADLGPRFDDPEFRELLDQTVQQATTLAYLDGLSPGVLFVLFVVLAFVAEGIRIVAIRVFASDETESIPAELATRNLAWVTLNGVLGGIVVLVLAAIGLLLLVLPGLFLFVSFYFVRQEIAIEDSNFVEAMADSWELTRGSRFEILAVAVILVLVNVGVSFLSDVFLIFGTTAASIGAVVLGGFAIAFSVAVVSRAYVQLKDDLGGADQDGDDLEAYMDEDLDPI